jgi:hypothetical protein
VVRLILATGVLLAATAWPSTFTAAHQQRADAHCDDAGVICVPPALEHVELSNPVTFDVTVKIPDTIDTTEIHLTSRLRDTAGRELGKSPAGAHDRALSAERRSLTTTFHVREFVVTTAVAPTGTLTLSVEYSDTQNWLTLAHLSVPVVLPVATATVTVVAARDSEALWHATDAWMASWGAAGPQPLARFNPHVRLDTREVTIMRLAPGALIGATAEAAIGRPNQGDWHVVDWSQSGRDAHVTIDGETWTNSSVWVNATKYLIRQSILRLPGIRSCTVETASPGISSGAPR